MGMTGHIVGAADCLLLGLATAQVPAGFLADLKEKLLHVHVDQMR